MEKHSDTPKPAVPVKVNNDATLVSDVEAAAAQDEPMGSIAAAVPGNDATAEDGLERGKKPGAEESKIRKEAGSTAGTEFHQENEKSKGDKDAA